MFTADRSLGANRWPVVRLVAGSQAEVVLLSSRFFALTVHWDPSPPIPHSVPCPGDDCPLCEMLTSRGLFYVAVGCNSRVSILELASQSSSLLEQHCKLLHGGMRPGLVLRLSRRGSRKPILSEALRFQEKCSEVSMLDLATKVMALFKFPPPNPGEELHNYSNRCSKIARVRIDRIATAMAKRS